MAKKSKLLAAVDAHKGRSYEAEKRKKQIKVAEKRKRQRAIDAKHDTGNEQSSTLHLKGAVANGVSQPKSTAKVVEDDEFESIPFDSDTHAHGPSENETSTTQHPPADDPSASEDDADSDVAVSDLSGEDLADTIPHQRMTINNGPALLTSMSRIRVLSPSLPFSTHNALISSLPPTSTTVPDPNDDLTRELEFYRICKAGAETARTLLLKEDIPFSRPSDYFAEMVKSDEHMGRVKKKMYDDAAGKKAAEEARRLRDAKKFGKAVQVAKEQERAREKTKTLERIEVLKRKRKGQDTGRVNEADDLFENVDVEEESGKGDHRGKEKRADGNPSFKRQKRDQKFGFGGKKRFAKSGDAASSADIRDFSAKRMKAGRKGSSGTKRLGKSRRAAAR